MLNGSFPNFSKTYKPSRNRLFIGIKKLLGIIDTARHFDADRRVIDFLTLLESEGYLEMA